MSKIPYNLSKIKGVVFDIDGVLSPAVVPLGADGVPQRMANLRDGYAIRTAADKGIKMAIISGSSGSGIVERFNSLGISDVYLKAGVKKDLLLNWMEANGLSPEEVAYAGDDIPDRECMQIAGLAVAPADAAPEIISAAGYVSPCNGGYGVARDLLEEILRAQSLWPLTDVAYG